jgi:signal transduction histidine kinase
MVAIQRNRRAMATMAQRTAALEGMNAHIEDIVLERTAALSAAREQYRNLLEGTQAIPWETNLAAGQLSYLGPQAEDLFGVSGTGLADFFATHVHPDDVWREIFLGDAPQTRNVRLRTAAGVYLTFKNLPSESPPGSRHKRGLLFDVTQQLALENELRQAQKLESVGRLASGIAHEINTPIQYVSDNVNFARETVADLWSLLDRYEALRAGAGSAEELAEYIATIDLGFLREQLPVSLARALEGVERVTTLVRSMKEFAHPDSKEKSLADLNRAIQTTLNVAHNEYKYIADVVTDLGDLPPISCRVSEINQVILNLVVNAAHAIADFNKGTEARGKIGVRTRAIDGHAVVEISDTGGGIPEAVRERIFDPFFTTKEIGRGTGQGLAIARSVIVDKHHGTLSFDTHVGVGTTFRVALPVEVMS